MARGYLFALISMSFFGLAFSLPLLAPGFTSTEIALGRFICFGTISVCSLLVSKKASLPAKKHFPVAFLFCLAGFVVYYNLLVASMKLIGGPLATLVSALMPLTVSVYGNFKNKEFPFSLFVVPILLIMSGITLINYEGLFISSELTPSEIVFGLLYALFAIAMWAWYAVHNGRFLKTHPHIRPSDWSALIGLISLVISVIAFSYLFITNPDMLYITSSDVSQNDLVRFLFVCLALGIGGSFLSVYFFNKASLLLPMSILGQLIVFEILFGLLYIYLIVWQLPSVFEIAGTLLVLSGITISFAKTSKRLVAEKISS